MTITVYGMPAPQGSKRFLGVKNGRGVMVESSKAVKPWREAVKWAALFQREVIKEAFGYNASVITGPVEVTIVFTLPRPKGAKRGALPAKKPDLSKLVRSTEDALTDAGVWEDDARCIHTDAWKVYPGEHPDALEIPGAVIRIEAVTA